MKFGRKKQAKSKSSVEKRNDKTKVRLKNVIYYGLFNGLIAIIWIYYY